ncbi:MAG: hypothetical protein DRO67_09645 [Candidatus Asgardarchaeum californiense]|nr:MAG: hypothetical protein DRO67_09645 [Candidatus Asgardarchaeum californiense]
MKKAVELNDVVTLAFDCLDKIDLTYSKCTMMAKLADALIDIDNRKALDLLNKAQTSVEDIMVPQIASEVLETIVKVYIKLNYYQAFEVTKKISDLTFASKAFARIAEVACDKDESFCSYVVNRAIQTAGKIDFPLQKAIAYSTIAESIARHLPKKAEELLRKALNEVEKISEEFWEVNMLVSIISAYKKLANCDRNVAFNFIKQAESHLYAIKDTTRRLDLAISLSELLIELDKYRAESFLMNALSDARQIMDAYMRSEYISRVAVVMAKLLPQRALNLVDEINDPIHKCQVLLSISASDSFLRLDAITRAINIAEHIAFPYYKSQIFSKIIEQLVKINKSKARELLAKNLEIAKSIENPVNKCNALISIIMLLKQLI